MADDGRVPGEQEPSEPGERAKERLAWWAAMIQELFSEDRYNWLSLNVDPDLAAWVEPLVEDGGRGAPNVIITGPPGIGKTWQALTVIRAAYMQGWDGSAIYVHPERWRNATRPPVEKGALKAWAECDVLILDDLGALRLSDWDAETLYMLLDDRWRHARPTVVVSNDGDLRGMLGERTASRLAQFALMIELTPADPEDPDRATGGAGDRDAGTVRAGPAA
jgi:DNA replication protein DnaC